VSQTMTLNLLPCKFDLTIKYKESGESILRARFVISGHPDREKSRLVHTATTLRHSSLRLLLALAATLDFDVWTVDADQAYLQAAERLPRSVFVKHNALRLSPGEIAQILKPLYGLADSGDLWAKILVHHHLKDLAMSQSTSEFSLFLRRAASELVGLSGCYVDDIIQAGTPEQSWQFIRRTHPYSYPNECSSNTNQIIVPNIRRIFAYANTNNTGICVRIRRIRIRTNFVRGRIFANIRSVFAS
jgi:hypothetical protein